MTQKANVNSILDNKINNNSIMNLKISEIKKEFDNTPTDNLSIIINKYKQDERTGVIKIVQKYENSLLKLTREKERTEKMKEFEYKYCDYEYICGIDEVGRGPLAGPVVAAAVILPKDCSILYINDSKQLSEKKREELFQVIMEQAIAVGVGVVPPSTIDDINILQATYEAMRIAITKLKVAPTLLLVDAVHIPDVSMKQVGIVKGDEKSISIAAASIIAKVTRDNMMKEYDKLYPEYSFAKNKGYGSAEHIQSLKNIGPSPIHRNSFIKNFV